MFLIIVQTHMWGNETHYAGSGGRVTNVPSLNHHVRLRNEQILNYTGLRCIQALPSLVKIPDERDAIGWINKGMLRERKQPWSTALSILLQGANLFSSYSFHKTLFRETRTFNCTIVHSWFTRWVIVYWNTQTCMLLIVCIFLILLLLFVYTSILWWLIIIIIIIITTIKICSAHISTLLGAQGAKTK